MFRFDKYPECCKHPMRKTTARSAFRSWKRGNEDQKHKFCKIYKDQKQYCGTIIPEITEELENTKNRDSEFRHYVDNNCT